ncbi:MAG: hypothetical protein IPM95_10585 [Sphingobacteriales bacterium]|nr:hypothetical protein [Sphingobacteriales bacterium]
MRKFTQVFILLMAAVSAKAQEFKILSTISVETDYEYGGVKGFNITYKYNFLSLEEFAHNDTLLRGCEFKLTTQLLANNEKVKPAQGYKSVTNSSGVLEYTIKLKGREIQPSYFDKKVTQFIPYAALNLTEGENTVTVQAEMSGKDADGHLHQHKKEKKDISFKKPPTKLFTLNIDYIEVNPHNAKGHVWDYAMFNSDAPDVGVNVLVGNTSVFRSNVNDSHMFAAGPNSKNISFMISAKDKISVLIQDIDVLFHDLIAKWEIATRYKKDGQVYTYDNTNANIKSCSVNYKIN